MKGSEHVRMTREEMAKRYPNHCLGLRDAVYPKDDDVNFISAEVVYTDKSKLDLFFREFVDKEPIFTWDNGDESPIAFFPLVNSFEWLDEKPGEQVILKEYPQN